MFVVFERMEERESKGKSNSKSERERVCACVYERERERVCVCVCMRERERERMFMRVNEEERVFEQSINTFFIRRLGCVFSVIKLFFSPLPNKLERSPECFFRVA